MISLCNLYCGDNKSATDKSSLSPENRFAGYYPNHPDEIFELGEELREISGISFFENNKLFCVQDEIGMIFIYDMEDDEITDEIEFHKENDYEGIAFVNGIIYVLASDGDLYEVKDIFGEPDTRKHDSKNMDECNAEGLAYDQETNSLLIACKDGTFNTLKYIYRFYLDKEEYSEEPEVFIRLKEIEDHLIHNRLIRVSQEINKIFTLDHGIFEPSALAIHPQRKTVFILSAKNNLIIEINKKGHVLDAFQLENEYYHQPEGLDFSSDGTMFISNEGNGGLPNILKFNYHEKEKE